MRGSAVVAAGCGVLTVALGLVFAGDRAAGGVDDVAQSAITGWPHWLLRVLVLPTEPYVLIPVLVLLAAWCLRAARRWDAAFVIAAPAVAVAANTWLLKPLFDRWKNDTLVYPSGHTVSMVATVAVVFLVVRRYRRATAVIGAVLLVAVTAGMIGLGYHYLTDVVGGAFFATGAVLALRTWWPSRPVS